MFVEGGGAGEKGRDNDVLLIFDNDNDGHKRIFMMRGV